MVVTKVSWLADWLAGSTVVPLEKLGLMLVGKMAVSTAVLMDVVRVERSVCPKVDKSVGLMVFATVVQSVA